MDQSLAEKSYEHIRRQLSEGALAPGKRLVNRTLAEEIGVSVIPVREAIHRLASEGLVEHVPGAGAFVKRPSRQDLDNLYVLRDALESCAAAEAARYITEIQLDDLEALLETAEQIAEEVQGQKSGHASKRQFDRWLDVEEQFHERLIEASRNPLLIKVVADHRAISEVFAAQRNNPAILSRQVAKDTCQSKRELLQALRVRDAGQARDIVSGQIQRGRRMVVGVLD